MEKIDNGEPLLEVKDLWVDVGGTTILKGVNLRIEKGRVYMLFGPNGSGKTTLLNTIIGEPQYRVTKGDILFKGQSILDIGIHERARLGIGYAFQSPPAIKGVKLATLLKHIGGAEDAIKQYTASLNMEQYMSRDVNLGFSGGERKRSEILQILLMRPELSILDEPESGVDIENLELIARHLLTLFEMDKQIRKRSKSGLIITHTGFLIEYFDVYHAFVMVNGRIICSGSARELRQTIKEHGFQGCMNCERENGKQREEVKNAKDICA